EWKRGRVSHEAAGDCESERCRWRKFETQEDRKDDRGEQEGRPVIGKDSRDRSAQNDDQRKQPVPVASAPASDMERGPGKEAGFVEDQRNDDQRDEGEGGIPDNVPDDADIAPTDDAGKKGNSSSSQR